MNDIIYYSVIFRDGRVGMFSADPEALRNGHGIAYLDSRSEKAGSEVSHIVTVPSPEKPQ